MMPGNFPLKLYRGDSRRWEFRLWKNIEKTEPADLTDVVAESEIRNGTAGSLIVVLECTVQLPNSIVVQLSSEMSRLLPLPPAGVWDLQLTYAGGDVRTILAGQVTVTADVTGSSRQVTE